MDNCIFCKIVKKENPANILLESDDAVMIEDIHPSAPIHFMVVSKRHIDSIADISRSDEPLIGRMVSMAKEGAEKLSLSGYKLVFNVGPDGGQIIDHIHLHMIGGWKAGEPKKITV